MCEWKKGLDRAGVCVIEDGGDGAKGAAML